MSCTCLSDKCEKSCWNVLLTRKVDSSFTAIIVEITEEGMVVFIFSIHDNTPRLITNNSIYVVFKNDFGVIILCLSSLCKPDWGSCLCR